MNRLRQLALAFGVALVLVFGQAAAALHDLGHAAAQLGDKGGKVPLTCDQCFACAQLSGGATSTPPAIPLFFALGCAEAFTHPASAQAATIVRFRSRAPPSLS